MSDQTDFIALYRELGVEPDCSVDELRLAYRRRVADLHPDRVGAAGEDELKSLNLRYAATLEFHRHYGRLPGAPPAPVARRHPDLAGPPQWMDETLPAGPVARRPSKIVVYGIMLLAMLLVWWLSRTGTESPRIQGVGIVENERKKAPPTAMALQQGMSMHDVVGLLGEPVSREHGDTYWVYGPSWIRFECAQVIDWYSSPLQPLRASRSRSPDAAASTAGTAGVRRCPPAAMAPERQRYAP